MKIENIKAAIKEAQRFIDIANELLEAEDKNPQSWICLPKQSGATKRSSMDLTRTLSKMRQDNV